ncbi:hypothetical protein TUBRATIS_004670 [Tubulinosema ratisbonensis]|uniref:Uncharacterized protein n=1 Tax=Tubulinosema ratisbonensis TaxID=291195 RepID=A0A437AP55_9MICR|nr:hypothetical protein TUBRATIS_004670 [Tubulinosema ratisbonensis]
MYLNYLILISAKVNFYGRTDNPLKTTVPLNNVYSIPHRPLVTKDQLLKLINQVDKKLVKTNKLKKKLKSIKKFLSKKSGNIDYEEVYDSLEEIDKYQNALISKIDSLLTKKRVDLPMAAESSFKPLGVIKNYYEHSTMNEIDWTLKRNDSLPKRKDIQEKLQKRSLFRPFKTTQKQRSIDDITTEVFYEGNFNYY